MGLAQSKRAFQDLNASVDPLLVMQWTADEMKAMADSVHSVEAMDIYDVRLDKGSHIILNINLFYSMFV